MTASTRPTPTAPDLGNLRAAGWMTGAMAMFAVEDAAIKVLGVRLGAGQIVAALGAAGLAVFWALLARDGGRLWTRDLLRPAVVLRNAGELLGTLCFVSALALSDLASASAILQALPLALVMGGALFLGERVGWRRWAAILAGFAGVLMIVRPGTAAFQPASLLALVAVAGLALRDLSTRRMPRHVPSHQLSASAYAALIPGGLALAAAEGRAMLVPDRAEALALVVAVLVGTLGYAMMVRATRVGEASAVAPFRYTRLVFTLVLAVAFFGERPDAATLAGAAVIVGAGSFAMWREFRRARAAGPPPGPRV
ncbi:DMT family transporter [Paracoccus sanguinis]|uniref:Permease of the drug/metabolite transporter (DMT) superfamily n=1 Tax=Paracoccus sanguinis TaxID=1545044 RepID=A0A1H2SWX5_9RHOB|nr:DMT family transporter [Paracoccus sanguinis]SDW36173.1 Permease of the drug/metabolite transporter (DMT) superfamily [Paracoccus sanguinis]